MKTKRTLAMLAVLVLLFPASSAPAVENIYAENFRVIADIIHTNYYKPIDFNACTGVKTIRAIHQCTDEDCFIKNIGDAIKRCLDPNSRYIPSLEVKQEADDIRGNFGGVGLELFQDKKIGEIVVVGVIPGTPADGSGIAEGDVLVRVDAQKIHVKTRIGAVVKWIRGDVGTEVKLYVRRNGVVIKTPFVLKRKIVVVEVVSGGHTPDAGIAYVRLARFTSGSSVHLFQKIKEAKDAGKSAVIFDLRNDPGGLLDEAVCVVSLFVPRGTYVVVTEHLRNAAVPIRAGSCKYFSEDTRTNLRSGLTFIVLVNGNSASASEVVAANLKELGVVVVGSRTYKKGTVQQNFGLWNGLLLGNMHLTTAEYRTGPNDTVVDGVGVEPNVEVLAAGEKGDNRDRPIFRSKQKLDFEHDVQLKKALEILQNEIAK